MVGHIRKTWGGVVRDWITDAGLFEVEFGKVRHPQFKGLAIACALFLSRRSRAVTKERGDSIASTRAQPARVECNNSTTAS